jgi:thioredoxin reductase (NADPH)
VKFGATIKNSQITSIDLESHPKKLIDSDGCVYYAAAVIIATGSTPNKLGLDKENELWSKGISSCAVCDGALYKKKKIIVVGGGDSAMEEAAFLTKFSDVTLIHRGDSFRASKAMQNKVLNNEKIKILYNTVITKLNGSEFIESVSCQNTKTKKEMELKVDGLFYGLGLKPNSHLFKGFLQLDHENYILKGETTNFTTMTSIDGVFVAGDVHDKIYRQAIVACGDGCRAAMDSIKWCEQYIDYQKKNGNVINSDGNGEGGCVFS